MPSALIRRSDNAILCQRQQKMHAVLHGELCRAAGLQHFRLANPQTSASAFQKVDLAVILTPKRERAAPTRSTTALLQPQRGAIAAASTLTRFTCNFKSWGDAIRNSPGSSSLQRRSGDSPCAPCRWRSLRRCRRLHRNPRYMGNYTHAAPAALG